jgi:hypothetical protein
LTMTTPKKTKKSMPRKIPVAKSISYTLCREPDCGGLVFWLLDANDQPIAMCHANDQVLDWIEEMHDYVIDAREKQTSRVTSIMPASGTIH